jgi:phosphate transport system permease protein
MTLVADPHAEFGPDHDSVDDHAVAVPHLQVGDGHAGGATVLPQRPGPEVPAPDPRPIGKFSKAQLMTLVGALASTLCITALLFGRFAPLRGKAGFVVVGLMVFVAVYAVLVSQTDNRPAVVDRVMTVMMTTAAMVAFAALASVIAFVIYRGWDALTRANFYVNDLSITGPQEPLSSGGILHAILGTLIMTLISLVITVPLGVACAVYLNESRSRTATLVRTVVTAMTALPSILAGLFIFATWILVLGYERSGLAASIAMSIMILPILIRSADVVLRLVPGSLREAAAALGAPQWRTVWHVVLPTARSGLTTSVILGLARGIGETAPVLLTAGYTASLNLNPTKNPMVSLPLASYELVKSPSETLIARGFGAAAALMILVLVLFSLARVLGGRPAGRLSKRQSKRSAARSARDLVRIEGAPAPQLSPEVNQ